VVAVVGRVGGVTPIGEHQPPDDGPLSQRTVLKPFLEQWRFE
jgi:hypothetical protein